MEPIHMQLSQKQITFSGVFLDIFDIYIKVGTSWKNDEPYTWCTSEITDSKKRDDISV